MKGVWIGKKEAKLFLITDNMILETEDPKSCQKPIRANKQVQLVAGHRINIQKAIIFLYTSSELSENEIKETISIIIASKRMKSLGTNFNKRYS